MLIQCCIGNIFYEYIHENVEMIQKFIDCWSKSLFGNWERFFFSSSRLIIRAEN